MIIQFYCREDNPSAFGGVAQGIIYYVREDLGHSPGINFNIGKMRSDVQIQRDIFAEPDVDRVMQLH